MRFSTVISAAALFELSIAGYVLEDDYMKDFYSNFNFFTGEDPTEGFVQYVDEATARSTNLINSSSTTSVQWGVDSKNKTPNGRPSMRIESKKKYNNGLIVLDVAHMPYGCGTWPAFWTIGPNWPKKGEIDILEGVNEMTNNSYTLHTGPGCEIGQDATQFSGELSTPNCDIAAEGQGKNVGCSIKSTSQQSYGAGLNKIRGGVFATQWNADSISMFFFPRGSVPADVLGDNPNPSGWGKPAAKFSGSCDVEEMFKEQTIIFTTTFCGQWAGGIWGDGSCAKKAATCDDFVRDNPEAFAEAYWTINALKVYQESKDANTPSQSSIPVKSSAVSLPLPAPTISSAYSTGAPLGSPAPVRPTSSPAAVPSASKVVPPVSTSKAAPEVPSKTAAAPSAPLPTQVVPSNAPSSKAPATPTQGAASSARPSKPVGSQGPVPTGANGMAGFQWPLGGVGNAPAAPTSPASPPKASSAAASPPQATGTPVLKSSGAVVAPSTVLNIAKPTGVPLVSIAPGPQPSGATGAPPGVPFIPAPSNVAKPVKTVRHTVYVTVPADAAETPKARAKRHAREHRQRLTRHNVRA